MVANAWDANATVVEITIPEEQINQQTSEIIISDNGIGMSCADVYSGRFVHPAQDRGISLRKYLIIGRDRREEEQVDKTQPPHERKIPMGRKGIGKFSNATVVKITIPEGQINQQTSEIIISDNGVGMSDRDVREKYLIIGRDRREKEQVDKTPPPHERPIMGRKGIGKFSAGIAKEML